MGTRCCFTVRTCKLSSTGDQTKRYESNYSYTGTHTAEKTDCAQRLHHPRLQRRCRRGTRARPSAGASGRSSSPWRRTCAGPCVARGGALWHNGQNLLIAQCRFLAASGLDSTKELVNLCIDTLFIYTRTEEDSVGLQPAREQLARAPRVLTAAAPVPAAVARPQEYSCNSTRKTAGPRAAGVSPLSRSPLQCQPSGRPQAPCTS